METKKRKTRRGKVATETLLTVSDDTWLLVCGLLYFSPHCVFRLMRASKSIWLALKDNEVFWNTFYKAIKKYQVAFPSLCAVEA